MEDAIYIAAYEEAVAIIAQRFQLPDFNFSERIGSGHAHIALRNICYEAANAYSVEATSTQQLQSFGYKNLLCAKIVSVMMEYALNNDWPEYRDPKLVCDEVYKLPADRVPLEKELVRCAVAKRLELEYLKSTMERPEDASTKVAKWGKGEASAAAASDLLRQCMRKYYKLTMDTRGSAGYIIERKKLTEAFEISPIADFSHSHIDVSALLVVTAANLDGGSYIPASIILYTLKDAKVHQFIVLFDTGVAYIFTHIFDTIIRPHIANICSDMANVCA